MIAVIGMGTLNAPFVNGQSGALVPKWEAVSIKPCVPGERGAAAAAQGPGRLTMFCAPVEVLIHHSYLLFPNGTLDLAGAKTQVTKGPAWMYSDQYTVEAKAEVVPGEPPPGQAMMQGPMLRLLLADRFKLEVHRGTREVPVYALTVTKEGPKVQAATEGSCIVADLDHPAPPPVPGLPALPACGLPRLTNNGMDFRGATMAQVSAALSTRTDRKVIDKTGMEGRFDFQLIWLGADLPPGTAPPPSASPQSVRLGSGPGPPPPPPGEVTARIQGALQKVGLKLEPAQGPEDVLIVDHVERPSGN